MAHSVAEAAARAVKNPQRVQVETRTPEQRLSDIRKNRAAKLFITPDDQDFLLMQYDFRGEQIRQFTITRDEAAAHIAELRKEKEQLLFILAEADKALQQTRAERDRFAHEMVALTVKLEEFRTVYEGENRSMALKIERVVEGDREA